MAGLTIAIDGPSGSGKSSVARAIAIKLGLAYPDTGAMYRAATLAALRGGIALSDAGAVEMLVRDLPLRFSLDPQASTCWLGADEISEAIRSTEVSSQVSQVATNLPARALLVDWQRSIVRSERQVDGWSQGRGIVAEGRDITTVVAPAAEVRLLLTASPAARLRRRAVEVHGQASTKAMAATRDQVLRRDKDDSAASQFMQAAPGVTALDSSELTLEQTIAAVLDLVRAST